MILIIFFLFGLFSMTSQIILVREFLVVFYGNELCLGSIFFSWLIGISAGAYFFRSFSAKIKKPVNIFVYLLITATVILPIEIYVIRNLRSLAGISAFTLFPFHQMFIATFVVTIPVCFIIGILFPLGVKIFNEKSKNPLSKIYLTESLGGMAGGILFTFIFVNYLNHFQIIFSTGISLLVAILLFLNDFKLSRKMFYVILLVCLILGLFLFSSRELDNWLIMQRWQSFATGLNFTENKDSKYGNISIGVRENQYSIFENGHVSVSFPDAYSDASLIHPVLIQHNAPEKVLFIGLPTIELAKESFLHNIKELHFVQLDPELYNMVSKYYNVLDVKGVKIFSQDGRFFLKNTHEKYDIVVINLSDPATSLVNRFYTKEFFYEVKKVLNPDGVFVTGITSAVNYLGEDVANYNVSVYHTLKKVFKFCVAAPGSRVYFFASDKDNISLDADLLQKRYKSRKINSRYFNEFYFKTLFEKDKIEWLKKKLETYPVKVENTDLKPVAYFFNLMLWSKFTNDSLPSFLNKVFSKQVILIFLLIIFAWIIFKKPAAALSLKVAIIIVGLTGMFLEIILLFLFQNLRGYLYSQIGLFVGLFMLGLAAGAWFFQRLKKITINTFILFQIILIFAIIITSALTFILKGAGTFWLYVIFTGLFIISGYTVGALFPVANKLYIDTGAGLIESASKLDSFDHLGAGIGALAGGTFLIPILGIGFSCVFLIVLNLLSIIALKISR